MEFFNNLTKIQKIILLLIAGFASIIGLSELSYSYRDYYVTAALSKSFFSAVLLFVLASPFLYLFRKKNKH